MINVGNIKRIKYTKEEEKYMVSDKEPKELGKLLQTKQTFKFENKLSVEVNQSFFSVGNKEGKYQVVIFDEDYEVRDILGFGVARAYTEKEVHNILSKVKDYIDFPVRSKEDIEADLKETENIQLEVVDEKAEPLIKDAGIEVKVTKAEPEKKETKKRTRKKKDVES